MLQRVKKLSTTKKIIGGSAIILLLVTAGSHSSQKSPQLNLEPSSDTKSSEQAPKIETKNITVTQVIPYNTTTQSDATLTSGKTVLLVAGIHGEKTIAYKVTYTDGKETGHEKLSEKVTKKPVNQVMKIGTKVAVAPAPTPKSASNCDPNYAGCVPIASDVDCAGGGGNGPAYFSGSTRVVGRDVYKLDRDHNGIACD